MSAGVKSGFIADEQNISLTMLPGYKLRAACFTKFPVTKVSKSWFNFVSTLVVGAVGLINIT